MPITSIDPITTLLHTDLPEILTIIETGIKIPVLDTREIGTKQINI